MLLFYPPGDGKIEYEEFMDTVKSSLATEKNEAGGMSADTRVVMDKLAAYLANSAVSAGCSDVLMGALSVSMYFRTSALSCALTHPPHHTRIFCPFVLRPLFIP